MVEKECLSIAFCHCIYARDAEFRTEPCTTLGSVVPSIPVCSRVHCRVLIVQTLALVFQEVLSSSLVKSCWQFLNCLLFFVLFLLKCRSAILYVTGVQYSDVQFKRLYAPFIVITNIGSILYVVQYILVVYFIHDSLYLFFKCFLSW